MAWFLRNGVPMSGEILPTDIPIPDRPGDNYSWDGSNWFLDKSALKQAINAKYDELYAECDKAIIAASVYGNDTSAIKTYKLTLMSQHKAEKEAVDNG